MKDGKPAKIVQEAGKLNRKIIKPTLELAAGTVKMENDLSIISEKDDKGQHMSAICSHLQFVIYLKYMGRFP